MNLVHSKEDNPAFQHSNREQETDRRQDQTPATDIEHVVVHDDPRKWSQARKVLSNFL